jgi:hypothetical protein
MYTLRELATRVGTSHPIVVLSHKSVLLLRTAMLLRWRLQVVPLKAVVTIKFDLILSSRSP